MLYLDRRWIPRAPPVATASVLSVGPASFSSQQLFEETYVHRVKAKSPSHLPLGMDGVYVLLLMQKI